MLPEKASEIRATTDIVEMSGVHFSWPGSNAFSLSVGSFALKQYSKVLLIGPSGSGKSTFLSLLCGVIAPQRGKIEVLDTRLDAMSSSLRDRFRVDHFGIIFQMFNLLPYGSVIDNTLLPLQFSEARRKRASLERTIEAEAERLLSSLGLDGPDVAGQAASKLSVGQQQRVAAARALIGRPELIIADEPTSSLDRGRQQAFLDLLFSEVSAAGSTLVMVSHDESLVSRFDVTLRLDDIAVSSRSAAA
ncbi:MAG: ATP-binding cassette domain-containing protein [Hyphomicrobium sp.]|nr:ATP-binding cassette domain-containing protein [Hyphomicrobium sp.]